MRESVLLVPSLQMQSWNSDGREARVLFEAEARLKAQGFRVVRDELARGSDRAYRFGVTAQAAAAGAPFLHVIAVSSSGDFVLDWLEKYRVELDVPHVSAALIGTFPSREYQLPERTQVLLLYGSEDYVAFVEDTDAEELNALTDTDVIGPSRYAADQSSNIRLSTGKTAAFEIVEGADHFLYSQTATSIDHLLGAIMQTRPQSGIEAFGAHSDRFAASIIHATPVAAPEVRRILAGLPALEICDVGCGAGHWGATLARPQDRVSFADASPAMLERAAQIATERGLRHQLVNSRAETLELPPKSFDVVTSRLAFHHFPDPAAAVARMRRLLKPEGLLILCDLAAPENQSLREIQHELETLHDPSHIRTYNTPELAALVEAAGLTVQSQLEPRWESAAGLNLDEWFDIVSTPEASRKMVLSLLHGLNKNQLQELGFSKDSLSYKYHATTITVIAKAKEEHHAHSANSLS